MPKDCVDPSPHGWTLDTLEEYLSSKIKALDSFTSAESRAAKEAVSAALAAVKEQSSAAMLAAEKAILKAESATEKRFEAVNEFRQTLSDQAANFLSRNEFQSSSASLVDKIDALDKRVSKAENLDAGKDTYSGRIGYLILGAFAFFSALAAIIIATVDILRVH